MTGNTSPDSYFQDDMINLRELVKTLLKHKWIIIGATALAGLAAFLVSSFLLSARYQASAYLAIADPGFRAELETSIQNDPIQLETSGLPELAEAAEMQQLTFAELGIADLEKQRAYEWSAVMQGEGQLQLRVTAGEPGLAAEAANAWAGVVSNRLNEIYSPTAETLKTLESEVTQAKANLSVTQAALESYLPKSQVESLEVELAEEKKALARYLSCVEGNNLLVSDAETMLAQLVLEEDGGDLATGTALSIIALQQRAAGGISGTQFQIQGDQIMGVDYSVIEGRDALIGLVSALREQNVGFEMEIELKQEEIGVISSLLESERFKMEQLTQERNLARQAYTALSSQLEETRITMAQEERPARIGVKAVEPNKPSGPNSKLNTALAVLIGGMLAVGGVLLWNWWIEEEPNR